MQQIVRHIVERYLRHALRRARRGLHLDVGDALVLGGQKPRRQTQEQQADGDDQRPIDQQPTAEAADHVANSAQVFVATVIEGAIEGTEEALFRCSVHFAGRLQYERAKRRCER